ncbi:molybdenum cofactor guanylyltransferase [uncultured Devosia sp.]|uniref:molybdenum cofactor guanylyltransferase n=1 Tax=uncultured Devosia sp. TaxID=211434 RepID=UPI0035CC8484
MSIPHAVIIAGGQGDRLGGVRKAELRLGGQRLIDRVSTALGPVVSPLLVASGPGHRVPQGDYPGVPDLSATPSGPLAGLAAAVDWLAENGATDGLLVSVAVDTPFLPPDFVAVMIAALGSNAAVYASWGNDFYPPNALWRLECIAALPERIRAGTAPKSLRASLVELGANPHDWQAQSPLNPFDNLNTLGDLIRLGRRAAQLASDSAQ